jgi:hypothetical protein
LAGKLYLFTLTLAVVILWWRTVSINSTMDVIRRVLDGTVGEEFYPKMGLRKELEILQTNFNEADKHLTKLWTEVYVCGIKHDLALLNEKVFPPRRRKTDKQK